MTASPAKPRRVFSAEQGDLFRQLEHDLLESENAPLLDLRAELRGAMAEAMREARRRYGWSRDHVVDRMNLCLEDGGITRRKLDAWMAASREDHPMPADLLPAFCWATRSLIPLATLLRALDYEPVDRREQHALRLGELAITRARLAREERALRGRLGG